MIPTKRSMRRTAGLLFAALALVAAAAHADEPHVALFKNVAGSIKVVRKDGAVDAAPGTVLYASDKVVSGVDATAGIVFKDGTLVTMGPSSEIQIRDYAFETKDSKYAFDLYLARGSAIYSSGKIGKLSPESVKVDTPTATVGVRGTRFIITVD